jgi:hypothetical protein
MACAVVGSDDAAVVLLLPHRVVACQRRTAQVDALNLPVQSALWWFVSLIQRKLEA